MKTCAIADIHANLPEIPDCSLLLIAGDITHHGKDSWAQLDWIIKYFIPWVKSIRDRGIEVVGIAGNHDFVFQDIGNIKSIPWTYLQQSDCYINDVYIVGIPHTPYFCNWAFNAFEHELERMWASAAAKADIILTHGPPYGYCDYIYDVVTGTYKHLGSTSLRDWIDKNQPKYVICGHLHSGFGIEKCGGTTIINCALTNENYKLVRDPVVFEYC